MPRNMSEEQRAERIREMEEEDRLSLSTIEEVRAVASRESVFYRYGEGYRLVAKITTPEEFIDFMTKSVVTDHMDELVPQWVIDGSFSRWFQYRPTVAFGERDTALFLDGILEANTHWPSEPVQGRMITYNPYYDAPFRGRAVTVMTYDPHRDIQVKDEIIKRLPAVVALSSANTFDHSGPIEGVDLLIAPLNDLTAQPIHL